jgi:hypothetical protein
MVYNFKSCKSVIYGVFDKFNIESSEWESRAPEWITNAMLEMITPKSLKEITSKEEVIDYRFQLPCNLKLFIGITYNGKRLIRSIGTNTIRNEDKKIISEYNITDNGWVYIDGLETGEVVLTYKAYPFIFDKELNRTMPLIPDNSKTETALIWYCVLQLLYRGYKHPVLNFNSNSEFTNPAVAWGKAKGLAVASLSSLDADALYRLTLRRNSLLDFTEIDYNNELK